MRLVLSECQTEIKIANWPFGLSWKLLGRPNLKFLCWWSHEWVASFWPLSCSPPPWPISLNIKETDLHDSLGIWPHLYLYKRTQLVKMSVGQHLSCTCGLSMIQPEFFSKCLCKMYTHTHRDTCGGGTGGLEISWYNYFSTLSCQDPWTKATVFPEVRQMDQAFERMSGFLKLFLRCVNINLLTNADF